MVEGMVKGMVDGMVGEKGGGWNFEMPAGW